MKEKLNFVSVSFYLRLCFIKFLYIVTKTTTSEKLKLYRLKLAN